MTCAALRRSLAFALRHGWLRSPTSAVWRIVLYQWQAATLAHRLVCECSTAHLSRFVPSIANTADHPALQYTSCSLLMKLPVTILWRSPKGGGASGGRGGSSSSSSSKGSSSSSHKSGGSSSSSKGSSYRPVGYYGGSGGHGGGGGGGKSKLPWWAILLIVYFSIFFAIFLAALIYYCVKGKPAPTKLPTHFVFSTRFKLGRP